jgi:hypothetical protein
LLYAVLVVSYVVLGAAMAMYDSLRRQLSQDGFWLGFRSANGTYVLVAGEEVHPSLKDGNVYITLPDPTSPPGFHAYEVRLNLNPNQVAQLTQSIAVYRQVDRKNLPDWVLRELRGIIEWRNEVMSQPEYINSPLLSVECLQASIIAHGRPAPATSASMTFISYRTAKTEILGPQRKTFVHAYPMIRSWFGNKNDSVSISPVWPGFAINTLFYATLFAIPAPLVLWLTRRRRHRLGNCTNCNYNLTGLALDAPCPECGTLRRANPSPTPQPTPAAPPPHP